MTSFIALTAIGISGNKYELWAYPNRTVLQRVSGVYVFCRWVPDGHWVADYVGQAVDLNGRAGVGFGLHEKAADAVSLGTTHTAVMSVTGTEQFRCWVENDLIQSLGPPLNKIAPPGHGKRWA